MTAISTQVDYSQIKLLLQYFSLYLSIVCNMGELGEEVIKSARARIEMPFRHHFKPVNLCESGRLTVEKCMERGMDPQGYDCSGLAIASLCEVLDVSPAEWPREDRHTQQLAKLATNEGGNQGDFRLYYSSGNRIHLGVVTSAQEVIHASGLTKVVEEGIVTDPSGSFEAVRAIAVESLVKLLKR